MCKSVSSVFSSVRHVLAALFLITGFGISGSALAQLPTAADVVLCLDASSSLSDDAWQLQLQGTADGIRTALTGKEDGRARITIVQFPEDAAFLWAPSGSAYIPPGLDKVLVDSPAVLDSLLTAIEGINRPAPPFLSVYHTPTADCMDVAVEAICPGGTCPDDEIRRILDISSDGNPTVPSGDPEGAAIAAAAAAQAAGFDVLNVLAVGDLNLINPISWVFGDAGQSPTIFDLRDPDGLDGVPGTGDETITCVDDMPPPNGWICVDDATPVSGDQAFVVVVDDYLDYDPAIEAKLLAEVNPEPSLTIVKTATPATYSTVGDVISYSFLVTNTGNVDLDTLAVVDDKAADESCPVATLVPQQSTTCTASYTITQADLDVGSVTNIAYASGNDPEGAPVQSPNDTETVTAVQTPALTIVKTATPSTYSTVGDVISYSFLVTNTGNVTIDSLAVDDDMATDEACPVTTLAPTASTTCTASYTIGQADLDAGSVTNIAYAVGNDPAGAPVQSPTDDETVTAVQAPALTIVKTAAPTTYSTVGDVIGYSFLVTNTGNVTIDTLAVVDDMAVDENCPINTLVPQQSTTCTASYTITQPDLDAGSVTNIAYATGTDPDGGAVQSPTDDETVTAVASVALTIVKTASPLTYSTVGDVIAYSFLVTNTGNVTIDTLAVVDDKAVDESCLVTTLAPTVSTTCTASYTITQADLDAGSVVNIAYATGNDPTGAPGQSPTDTETVTAVQTPALTIVKTATPSTYSTVGDVISYSFLVTNTGNVTIDSLAVDDDMATDEACPVTTLAPTASTTCTASYTIGQADLDAGSVTNIAYAVGNDPAGVPVQSPTDTETVTALGNLTIVKTAVGGDGTFNFTSAALGNFDLTTVAGTDEATFPDLASGIYDVTETGMPAGWTAVPAVCDDGSAADAIDLAAGESVICEFVNLAPGDIVITVETDSLPDQEFCFDVYNRDTAAYLGQFCVTTVNGVAQVTADTLPVGPYRIEEVPNDIYMLEEFVCDNGSQNDLLVLDPGDVITCPFRVVPLATDVPVPASNAWTLALLTLMMLAAGWYFNPAGRRRS